MTTVTHLLLNILIIHSIRAEISVKDYVYWTKADISAWHQYFPSRLLWQEQLTNKKAADTVTTLSRNMETSLAATVRYQAQELETAQYIMEGTSAQGCVSGISTYMDRAITEAVESYDDCVADVIPSLQRLYVSWIKTNASYQAAYQKALKGIDSCARTYTNRDSWSRLKTCVDSFAQNYFTVARSTTNGLNWSPAMGRFTGTVAGCAQTAMSDVVFKGWKFLSMLVQCAKLSENVDSEMYEEQLTSEFNKYVSTNNVMGQIWESQRDNGLQVADIEQEMLYYYDIQKSALEKYVIESRNQSYYHSQLVQHLQKYLDTVSSTLLDNPANAVCVDWANMALSEILNNGAIQALKCDVEIVTDTKLLITRVNDIFSQINSILPYIGNVAIISCFDEGYIFAEDTILNCFSLTANSFNINVTELNAKIVDDVEVLRGYEKSFFSNSSLPCGRSILSSAVLEADRTLYNLQRCLYINTGTNYAVTTPAPAQTTSASAQTTEAPTQTTAWYNPTAVTTEATTPTTTTTPEPWYDLTSTSV